MVEKRSEQSNRVPEASPMVLPLYRIRNATGRARHADAFQIVEECHVIDSAYGVDKLAFELFVQLSSPSIYMSIIADGIKRTLENSIKRVIRGRDG